MLESARACQEWEIAYVWHGQRGQAKRVRSIVQVQQRGDLRCDLKAGVVRGLADDRAQDEQASGQGGGLKAAAGKHCHDVQMIDGRSHRLRRRLHPRGDRHRQVELLQRRIELLQRCGCRVVMRSVAGVSLIVERVTGTHSSLPSAPSNTVNLISGGDETPTSPISSIKVASRPK